MRRVAPVLVYPVIMFLASRGLLVASLYYTATIALAGDPQGVHDVTISSLVERLAMGDGGWYLSIASNGYHYDPSVQSNVTFFPLYPLTVKLLATFLGDLRLSGVILSNTAFLLSLIVIYRMAIVRFNPAAARAGVALLACYPFSFYFSAVYTESLFLLLAVLSFFMAERKHWALSSIFGMLASGTRLIGVALLPALLIMRAQQEDRHPLALEERADRRRAYSFALDVVSLCLVPLGAMLFTAYLWWRFGDPLIFATNNLDRWGDPWLAVRILAALALGQPIPSGIDAPYYWHFVALANALLVAFLFCTGLVYRRLRLTYAVFSALVVAIPLVTQFSFASGRYTAVAWPVFVAAGLSLAGTRSMLVVFSASALLLGAIGALYFIGGPII